VTHEAGDGGRGRRFEAATLRIVFPLLVLYVVVAALPLGAGMRSQWLFGWALQPVGDLPRMDAIFRAIAHIAAFTVLGYAIAEYHGRTREQVSRVLPTVIGAAAALSALIEIARGWHQAHVASALMFVFTVSGAALGSALYALQLAHVRALVRRPAISSAAPR
jgi:hypothetical protein